MDERRKTDDEIIRSLGRIEGILQGMEQRSDANDKRVLAVEKEVELLKKFQYELKGKAAITGAGAGLIGGGAITVFIGYLFHKLGL
jgi:hypothetical protein